MTNVRGKMSSDTYNTLIGKRRYDMNVTGFFFAKKIHTDALSLGSNSSSLCLSTQLNTTLFKHEVTRLKCAQKPAELA